MKFDIQLLFKLGGTMPYLPSRAEKTRDVDPTLGYTHRYSWFSVADGGQCLLFHMIFLYNTVKL